MQSARVVSVVAVLAALGAAFWFMSPRDPDATPSPGGEPGPVAGPPSPSGKKGLIELSIFPPVADRFVQEPCNAVPGGGLFSLAAALDEVQSRKKRLVQVSMGDLTLAEGGVARHVLREHYGEVFAALGNWIVSAGEGELGAGSVFLKSVLTQIPGVTLLCGNALEPGGVLTFLRAWQVVQCGERLVLVVGVAGESLLPELERRGSDVTLAPPAAAARKSIEDGVAQMRLLGKTVDEMVLLVHGTVDETAAILAEVPEFTIAVAAHGPTLPAQTTRLAGTTPIYYGGQGMRFVWRVILPDDGNGPVAELARLGQRHLAMGSPYAKDLEYVREMSARLWIAASATTPGDRTADPRGAYVGAQRCVPCHTEAAADHASSPHGVPSKAIHGSNFAGSTGCIGCHTTAPYSVGGWGGPADTSDLAAVSCETCHGPGAAHAAKPEPGYGKTDFASCLRCHLPDRTAVFDGAAIWKGFGHRLK